MQSRMIQIAVARSVGIIIVTNLVIAGCASPYVRLGVASGKMGNAPSVAEAITYARNAHEIYRDKVVELGESERFLSNGLVTLGAAMLGLAAANAHSSAITTGALLGGTAYTLGVFNYDKRRPLIYISGMKAMECAIDAVSPLNFGAAAEADLTRRSVSFEGRINEVAGAIAEVESAMRNYEAAGGASSVLDDAAAGVKSARAAIVAADQANGLVMQLLLRQRSAGTELRNAVDKIDTAVLNEIRGTEPAIQSVPGIIAQLTKSIESFSSLAKAPASATLAAAEGIAPKGSAVTKRDLTEKSSPPADRAASILLGARQALAIAVGELQAKTALLNSLTATTSAIVAAVDQKKSLESLKACKAEGVNASIVATPLEVALVAKQAQRQLILVSGGNSTYEPTFLEDPVTGLSVRIPPRSKGVIEIVTTDQVAAGTYHLFIEDSTRQSSQTVTVTVKTAAAAAAAAAAATAPPGDKQSLMKKLSEIIAAAKTITTADGVTITIKSAIVSGDTVQVIYTVGAGKQSTDVQVRDALNTLPGVTELIGNDTKKIVAVREDATPKSTAIAKLIDRFGPVAAGLTANQIAGIQQNLCLTGKAVDGRWGTTTQGQLRKHRSVASGKNAAAGDSLSGAEADFLLMQRSPSCEMR